MTKIDPNLTSIDLQKSAVTGDEGGARFVIPWRMYSDNDQTRQQNDYVCSCGCGCRKGIKMAKTIQTTASALVVELTQLRARVLQLEKQAAAAGSKKAKAARKKK